MKRCPACNRSYSDDAPEFCTEDGARLVSDTSGELQPTMYAPSPPAVNSPPPLLPQQGFQPNPMNSTPGGFAAPPSSFVPSQTPHIPAPFASTEKKRKGLAIIALSIGIAALLATSLLLILQVVFRINAPIRPAMLPFVLLSFLGVALGAVALFLAFRNPATHGGKLASTAGILLSLLVPVLFVSSMGFSYIRGRPNYTPSLPTINTAPAPNTPAPLTFTGSVRTLFPQTVGNYRWQRASAVPQVSFLANAREVAGADYLSDAGATRSHLIANFASPQEASNAFHRNVALMHGSNRTLRMEDIRDGAGREIGSRAIVTAPNQEIVSWRIGSLYFAVGPRSATGLVTWFAERLPYYSTMPR